MLAGGGGWTLARRLRAGLLALCVLLLVAALVLVAVLRQADRALSDQLQRTFPARVSAGELLTSLVDQETGLRGYALTGDERFLEPYRQGLVAEQAIRLDLDGYVRPGDPARLALATVDSAITAWRDQYASLPLGGEIGPGDVDTIQFGRELFDRVRQSNAALDDALARQAEEAQHEADGDRRLVAVVLALMAGTLLAAVVAVQRALQTSVLRPLSRLAAQVAVVGAFKALQDSGKLTDDMFLSGVDGDSEALELVKAGGAYKLSIGFAWGLMGYGLGQFGADWIEGKEVPQLVVARGVTLDSAASVDQFTSASEDPASVFADRSRYEEYLPLYGTVSHASRRSYWTEPVDPPAGSGASSDTGS